MKKLTHVLLVEDNPQDAELIRRMLEKGDDPEFAVVHAAVLRDAIARLRSEHFDIILLDLGLPDSKGLDGIMRINHEGIETPVIVLTGQTDEELALKTIAMGSQDYLVKDQIDRNLLLRSIQYSIERKRSSEAIEESGKRLRESEERLRLAIDATALGTFDYDPQQGTFYCSDVAKGHFGLRPQAHVDYAVFLSGIHPEDRERMHIAVQNTLGLKNGGHFRAEYRTVGIEDFKERWLSTYGQVFSDEEGKAARFIAGTVDITEQKRMEEEVKHMADHDALTGLPNRRLFRNVAELNIGHAQRYDEKFAVLFLDLDRFKEVNDTLGHETGDLLLKETAARLKSSVRTSDTIARMGGDEFNILISDIKHPEYVADVARKIMNAVREPFVIKGHELNLSTSIGISIFPDDGKTINELLQCADIALYYAKGHGRNGFHFYSAETNARSIECIKFENALHRAIERQEFRLYFQPIIDIKSGAISSMETLLRWQRPGRNILMPGDFFESASDIGLMVEIEDWVLTNVGKQIRAWQELHISPPCVTVNISPRMFQRTGLVPRILRLVQDTGIAPSCLGIEITEATAMQDVENSLMQIEELRRAGVTILIDDFGTGYSSLSHLKRLPVQKLKIDRSFVRDVAMGNGDQKIVTAVVLLAHSLDLQVVAEGVENEEQLEFLRQVECDEAQGYFLSKPMPAESVKELLAV